MRFYISEKFSCDAARASLKTILGAARILCCGNKNNLVSFYQLAAKRKN